MARLYGALDIIAGSCRAHAAYCAAPGAHEPHTIYGASIDDA
jgi:hypothetical protein